MIPPINRLVWFLNIQYNKSKLIFLTFAKSLVSISSRFTAVCFKTSATLTEMVAIPAMISAGKHEIIKPGTGIWNSHFFNGSLAEKKNTSWCFMIWVPPSMLKLKTTVFFMKLRAPPRLPYSQSLRRRLAKTNLLPPRWHPLRGATHAGRDVVKTLLEKCRKTHRIQFENAESSLPRCFRCSMVHHEWHRLTDPHALALHGQMWPGEKEWPST